MTKNNTKDLSRSDVATMVDQWYYDNSDPSDPASFSNRGDAARYLGISRQHLSSITNGHVAIPDCVLVELGLKRVPPEAPADKYVEVEK